MSVQAKRQSGWRRGADSPKCKEQQEVLASWELFRGATAGRRYELRRQATSKRTRERQASVQPPFHETCCEPQTYQSRSPFHSWPVTGVEEGREGKGGRKLVGVENQQDAG